MAGNQYDENEPSVSGDQYVEDGQSSLPTGSTDSSGGQDRLGGVLPDTGGAPLVVGLLGALLIGGSIFAR